MDLLELAIDLSAINGFIAQWLEHLPSITEIMGLISTLRPQIFFQANYISTA